MVTIRNSFKRQVESSEIAEPQGSSSLHSCNSTDASRQDPRPSGPQYGADDSLKYERWSLGVLNVPGTREVPGSVFLLESHKKEPESVQSEKNKHSESSGRVASSNDSGELQPEKKKTADGRIILEPQPTDSGDDPLNWPRWRKDATLFSLGLYCMVGGGMTPILAAGFDDVASTFHVSVPQVALTTGLYMMGLGFGSVFASPVSLLFGKRIVYILSATVFIATSCWCAASPNYVSLLIARTLQGFSVSPVECLPSATISEIFFLHERAFKVGIYALLLVGGKNVVPLAGAAIVEFLGWRWIFWIVAMVLVICGLLLFFFVLESFRDRSTTKNSQVQTALTYPVEDDDPIRCAPDQEKNLQMHRSTATYEQEYNSNSSTESNQIHLHVGKSASPDLDLYPEGAPFPSTRPSNGIKTPESESRIKSDVHQSLGTQDNDANDKSPIPPLRDMEGKRIDSELSIRNRLKLYHGRMSYDNWFEVTCRPFKLFGYPAILWSAAIYSCSVGWLIVLSESVVVLFRSPDTYGFSALSIGLIYISPLIGGILGTAVAGKASDFLVQTMARRNGGLYEPEFRLVMAIPVTITTVIGLMGIGWSVQERDKWIIPVFFFGVISFGCSLGVTTAITFCVDSYKNYAVEALVTLNFSKNVFHGFLFSLFFTKWLQHDGPRQVFVWLGVIQLALMAFTIPMYIFGKRARMWTARKIL